MCTCVYCVRQVCFYKLDGLPAGKLSLTSCSENCKSLKKRTAVALTGRRVPRHSLPRTTICRCQGYLARMLGCIKCFGAVTANCFCCMLLHDISSAGAALLPLVLLEP